MASKGGLEGKPVFEVPVASVFEPVTVGDLHVAPARDGTNGLLFSRGADVYLFKLEPDLLCRAPIVSSNGSAVFLLIQKVRPLASDTEFPMLSLEYNCLARFDIPEAGRPLSDVKHRFFLYQKQLRTLLGGNALIIEALYRVSADQQRLLISVVAEDAAYAPRETRLLRKPCWYWLNDNQITDVLEMDDSAKTR